MSGTPLPTGGDTAIGASVCALEPGLPSCPLGTGCEIVLGF